MLLEAASTIVTAPASTTITLGPVYSWLTVNVFLPILGGIVLAIMTWATSLLQKNYNIKLGDSLKAEIQQTALSAAQRIFATQDAKFAKVSIDVKSPLIAEEAPKVIARAEDAYKTLGLTPDRVSDLILAKIGGLQAEAQAQATPVVVEAPKVQP